MYKNTGAPKKTGHRPYLGNYLSYKFEKKNYDKSDQVKSNENSFVAIIFARIILKKI